MTLLTQRQANRLGYLAARGMREERHTAEVADASRRGFEAGVIAANQSDECPHDPDRHCSDCTHEYGC